MNLYKGGLALRRNVWPLLLFIFFFLYLYYWRCHSCGEELDRRSMPGKTAKNRISSLDCALPKLGNVPQIGRNCELGMGSGSDIDACTDHWLLCWLCADEELDELVIDSSSGIDACEDPWLLWWLGADDALLDDRLDEGRIGYTKMSQRIRRIDWIIFSFSLICSDCYNSV